MSPPEKLTTGERILYFCILPHCAVYFVFGLIICWSRIADTRGVAFSGGGGGPSSDPSGMAGIAALLALLLIPILSFVVTALLAFRPWQRVRSGFLAGLISSAIITITPTLLSWIITYVASLREWMRNLGYG